LPYVNGVQLKFYGDGTGVSLALQAGDIDVYPNVTYAGNQALFHNSKVKILKHASSSYRELHMRVDTPPFTDKRVRQAVALSLDRPALVKGVLGGLGSIGNDHAWAPVLPLSAATKKIPQRKRDIAKAKQLLAAAGHPKGINVTLTYEEYLEIAQYAVTVKSMLAPAGINVTLHGEDQTTYYGSGTNQPWLQVPMGIVDWAPRGVPSQDITPAYLSSSIPPPYTGWNSAHWSNHTFDRLVADSDKQLNVAKRNADFLKAATIMHDDVPAVIAYWLYDMQATRNNVHGLKAAPGPYPDFSAVWLG
jgi:peptide/nickel transport system substrate-binding protein